MGFLKVDGRYTGPPSVRVPWVPRHPLILSNGCQAPVLKQPGTRPEFLKKCILCNKSVLTAKKQKIMPSSWLFKDVLKEVYIAFFKGGALGAKATIGFD